MPPFFCWWRQSDSNRPPTACKAAALPDELCPQVFQRFYRRHADSLLRPSMLQVTQQSTLNLAGTLLWESLYLIEYLDIQPPSTHILDGNLERDIGIEPMTEDWKSAVLPLN